MEYARRLADRHPPHHRVLIQTSMSPSGYFHVGNFRDTVCAHLVHRALRHKAYGPSSRRLPYNHFPMNSWTTSTC
ncbi:hypothetical protein ABZ086_34395 [Streptomyces halstedii]